MSQILAFDFGTFSIGVAVGQHITGTASPLAALRAKDGQPNWDEVAKLIASWQPQSLVVGLPLNMDGTEQPLTDMARKFANRLHGRFGLPVHLQDERLTTVAAKQSLFASGGYKNLQKDKVDSAAAQLILEDYLNRR